MWDLNHLVDNFNVNPYSENQNGQITLTNATIFQSFDVCLVLYIFSPFVNIPREGCGPDLTYRYSHERGVALERLTDVE